VVVCAKSYEESSSMRMVPAIHCIIVDVFTDIPMFITTMINRTYITFDIVIKFIVFIRSVIWVPYLLHREGKHEDDGRRSRGGSFYEPV
jgi:hypothetical protein